MEREESRDTTLCMINTCFDNENVVDMKCQLSNLKNLIESEDYESVYTGYCLLKEMPFCVNVLAKYGHEIIDTINNTTVEQYFKFIDAAIEEYQINIETWINNDLPFYNNKLKPLLSFLTKQLELNNVIKS